MKREFWLAVVCMGALGPPIAFGQRYARSGESLLSRPSDRSASVYIGGDYTRTSRTESLLATRRDVALLSQDRFEYARRQQRGVRGRTLPVSAVGLSMELGGPRGLPLSNFSQRTGELALISGLSGATDFRLPPPGVGAGGLPTLNAHLYTPRPPRTEFEEFFGLNPGWRPIVSDSRPFTSVATELERQTKERVDRSREAAKALWTAATVERRDPQTGRYPTCADCDVLLSGAAKEFQTVRDLDESDARALVFLTHIALEQDCPSLAGTYLIEAFQRDPTMLQGPPDELARAFGDYDDGRNQSLVLDSQLYRYKDTGLTNPGSVAAQLISAYCAWRLGDASQTRAFADQAVELARQNPESTEFELGFAAALQAALR